jgi:hypothetical protein
MLTKVVTNPQSQDLLLPPKVPRNAGTSHSSAE